MDLFPTEQAWYEMRSRRMRLAPVLMHPSFEAFNKYLDGYEAAYFLTLRKRQLHHKVTILRARLAIIEVSYSRLRANWTRQMAARTQHKTWPTNAEEEQPKISSVLSNAPSNDAAKSTGRWAVCSSIIG
jgi:hypothetical protein